MAKIKFTRVKSTVADAVGEAWAELESLKDEFREMHDNCNEGLQQTQKMQTVDETASTLENMSEPEVPDWLCPTEVTIQRWANARKGRGLSRADRCGQACDIIDSVVTELESEAKVDGVDQDKKEAVEALRDALEEIRNEAEGLEFPGMYG